MKLNSPFALLHVSVVVLLPHLADAHRSIPRGTTCYNQFGSPDTALTIPNSKVSWATYRIFTCENPIMWMDTEVDANQTLKFTVTVPVVERFEETRMTVVFVGPGFPTAIDNTSGDVPEDVIAYSQSIGEGVAVFKTPEDQSGCDHLKEVMTNASSVVDNRCHFYEPFSGSNSWVLLDEELVAPESGTYKVAFFTEDNTTAKAVFAGFDWPEDFVTNYDPYPEPLCSFCGTNPALNPAYSSHFFEQKSMEPFAGFPPREECTSVDTPLEPLAETQCPPIAEDVAEQPESCVLGCNVGGLCHSHNVFGECIYLVEWDLTPKVGDANVTELVLFKGDAVQFKYTGSSNAHNLFAMDSELSLSECNFDNSSEVVGVEEISIGHQYTFSEAGMFYFTCGIGCTGFGEDRDIGEIVPSASDASCHCSIGQRLIVEVKDASEGLKCHDHEDFLPSESSSVSMEPSECADSEVSAITIGNPIYMAFDETECAEFCTPAFALQFLDEVEAGDCVSKGFTEAPKQHTVTIPGAPGGPIEVRVTSMEVTEGASGNCHCHSYEEIVCPENETAEDTLYVEHIDEIEQYCQGILNGTEADCPYKCFQPIEVLHLHYIECPTRAIDPTYLAVNATAKCHKAANAPSGTDCPVIALRESGSDSGEVRVPGSNDDSVDGVESMGYHVLVKHGLAVMALFLAIVM